MENFNNVPSYGTFGSVVSVVNQNFALAKEAIDKLAFSKSACMGFYETSSELNDAHPTPIDGDWALVGNSSPFNVYVANDGSWVDSGVDYNVSIDNSIEINGLGGYVALDSIQELPTQPTNPNLGYLIDDKLYVYVGTGGDTLDGKYKDCGEFKGPQGEQGPNGVSLGDVEIADNQTTDDATKVLSARQGYILDQKVNDIYDDYIMRSYNDADYAIRTISGQSSSEPVDVANGNVLRVIKYVNGPCKIVFKESYGRGCVCAIYDSLQKAVLSKSNYIDVINNSRYSNQTIIGDFNVGGYVVFSLATTNPYSVISDNDKETLLSNFSVHILNADFANNSIRGSIDNLDKKLNGWHIVESSYIPYLSNKVILLNKWGADATRLSAIIPVSNYKNHKCIIDPTPSYSGSSRIGFLKSNSYNVGSIPDYSALYDSTIVIDKVTELIIPDDCNYLYVYFSTDAGNAYPYITFDGTTDDINNVSGINSVSISEKDFSVSDSIVYTNRCALIKKIPYQYDKILVKFTNNSPLYKFGIHVYDSFNNRLFQTAWLTSPNSYYFEIDSKNGAYIAIIAANNDSTTQIYYNDDILSDVIFDCRILGVIQYKEKNICVGRPCFEPVAHRGFHNLSVPENSLDAFRIAAEMGYLYCETDVHLTSDGVVVICHDKTVNKTYRNASDYSVIGSTIDITENTYQDLYDNYVQISSVKKYRKPMPTLKDFLVLCRDMGIKPLIEIKDDVDALTLATFTIAKKILGTDFGLIGSHYSQIDYARTLSDKILCGYIGSTSILNTTNTRSGESRNNDMNIWMPYNHGTLELSDEIIESYKENGIKLISYTDNDEQFSKHSILGYNYAMTNSVSPIIQKSSGFVVTSDNGWFDFDFVGCTLFDNTNPTENVLNPFYIKSVKMDEGDCIKVPIGNTNIRCLFAIYSVIEYKGLFEIKIGSNVTTIESEKLTKHTFGKLLNLDNQKLNSFLEVTAKQDGSLINDIIFNAVPYFITVTSK